MLEFGGQVFQVSVNHLDGFTLGGTLHFTSNDCSGIPYLEVVSRLFSSAAVAAPNQTLYATDSNDTPQNLTIFSTLTNGDCDVPGGTDTLVREALPLVDLSTVFTPPFSLQPSQDNGNGGGADHTHIYLTGKGKGHNKVEAETGLPVPPGTVPPPTPNDDDDDDDDD